MFACLEYDLQAHCHIDLLDLYRGKLSVRKLVYMLRHLPTDSALGARGLAGDDRWGMGDHLTAIVADYLHVLDYHFLQVNGAKNIKKPEMLPRPELFETE